MKMEVLVLQVLRDRAMDAGCELKLAQSEMPVHEGACQFLSSGSLLVRFQSLHLEQKELQQKVSLSLYITPPILLMFSVMLTLTVISNYRRNYSKLR